MAAVQYWDWVSKSCPNYLQTMATGSQLSVDEVLVREFKNIVHNPEKKEFLESGIMGITKLMLARAHGRREPPSPEVYEILMALRLESPRSERLLREASSILSSVKGCSEKQVVRILPHDNTIQ